MLGKKFYLHLELAPGGKLCMRLGLIAKVISAIDLQVYKIFKIMRVSFFGTQWIRHRLSAFRLVVTQIGEQSLTTLHVKIKLRVILEYSVPYSIRLRAILSWAVRFRLAPMTSSWFTVHIQLSIFLIISGLRSHPCDMPINVVPSFARSIMSFTF